MRVHLIATGGAVMHNMALALHDKGFQVSGSDDEIFDPAKSRLEAAGICPKQWGWFPEKITADIDVVILGMHAKMDNPELKKAQDLGLEILSFPEYLYENCKDKTRVVIGGSHGKTSITSMVMHVLRYCQIDFDYMVGAQLEGFDKMVKLSKDAKIAVFEGDEYLSSALDLRPKFHLYKPHVALLSGIAWDHINVFPTFDYYVDQFRIFSSMIEPDGKLVYFEGDEYLQSIASELRNDVEAFPYDSHAHELKDGTSFLLHQGTKVPIHVFGEHNLQNLNGARLVCQQLGISDEQFYEAISSFKGAAKRLQLLKANDHSAAYLDFAHSPSKLKATVKAVKDQYPERKLIACMELHTYSSLSEQFLKEYAGSMLPADEAVVFFDQHVLELKRLKDITTDQVKAAFEGDQLTVMNDPQEFKEYINSRELEGCNLLLMSSGNFSGIDFKTLADKLVK